MFLNNLFYYLCALMVPCLCNIAEPITVKRASQGVSECGLVTLRERYLNGDEMIRLRGQYMQPLRIGEHVLHGLVQEVFERLYA